MHLTFSRTMDEARFGGQFTALNRSNRNDNQWSSVGRAVRPLRSAILLR